jgi:hypothetical protein
LLFLIKFKICLNSLTKKWALISMTGIIIYSKIFKKINGWNQFASDWVIHWFWWLF